MQPSPSPTKIPCGILEPPIPQEESDVEFTFPVEQQCSRDDFHERVLSCLSTVITGQQRIEAHVVALAGRSLSPNEGGSRSTGECAHSTTRAALQTQDSAVSEYYPGSKDLAASIRASDLMFDKSRGQEVYQGWNAFAKRLSHHPMFESVFAAAIFINAIIMGCEIQYAGIQLGYDLRYDGSYNKASDAWQFGESFFDIMEWVFGSCFCLEVSIKILAEPRNFWLGIYDWIDVLCVLFFLLGKFAVQFVDVRVRWQTIRLLRLTRLGRLIRLARVLEGTNTLYLMATAIRGSVKILAWALVLLFMLLMTVSLFMSQILHAFYFDEVSNISTNPPGAADPVTIEAQLKVYEYFGTFTRSLLSMFELTLANWPPITRLLSENVSETFMFFCLAHKLTIGFLVVGVVNGVMMQETFKIAAADDTIILNQKKLAARLMHRKMARLFQALDDSGDGKLSYSEFKLVASSPDVKLWLEAMDVDTSHLRKVFNFIDTEKTELITAEQFTNGIMKLKRPASTLAMFDLLQKVKILQDQVNGFELTRASDRNTTASKNVDATKPSVRQDS